MILLLGFTQPAGAEPFVSQRTRYYYPKSDPISERSVLLPPILSFFVPGLDQWIEGQFGPATGYTLGGVGGVLVHQTARPNIDNRYRDIGLQMYFTAGALSLFHSFRTAASSRKQKGEYRFLVNDEKPHELLMSPLRYKYLSRWTTILPLVAGAALYFFISPGTSNSEGSATFGDLAYASGISYMTGISEELLFRGYLMPVLYQETQNPFLSVAASGTAYAFAHGLRFNHFITALAFGLYAGSMVQAQDWNLGEMIFVHTWLDLMAFLGDYVARREPAFLRIPPIHFTF